MRAPPQAQAAAAQDEGTMDQLRSKGILPALGVGGAVYLVTGVVSLGTLAMVGVGAGVGYGVGTWIRDKYEEKKAAKEPKPPGTTSIDQLPPQYQISVMQWQVYLGSRVPGQQITPALAQQIFMEFEQREPQHAANIRAVQHSVDGLMGATASTPLMPLGAMAATPITAPGAAEVEEEAVVPGGDVGGANVAEKWPPLHGFARADSFGRLPRATRARSDACVCMQARV
eukprot:CAMPEP_0204561484 /NCGR_PEP_ID=MMETSP0661-20131031/33213_1 /ASSEMBLY_ACC=CAM_ASM_000606 /TAXON_ID=109239 /ORGANISM="Alexandrium margalefi, Strain AMGDE01CS-322" /LENGTH=227 /DNA_ID=CAMNT_0051568899 /DNA_START=82 /DNA_END=762 /DNA_ORIENTATION=+